VNKLNFESENLVVDWISFKFQELEAGAEIKIIDYYSKVDLVRSRFIR
jgi:hypothetical protein